MKERFFGIVNEVTSLVSGKTSVSESFHGSASRVIDVDQGIGVKPAKGADRPVIVGQDFFVDIENDPYRTYINRLAAYGVLSSSQQFYPQNYLRRDDFAALLARIYKKSAGKELDMTKVDGLDPNVSIMTKWMLQQALRSIDSSGLLQIDGNLYDKMMRSEAAYYLVRFFDLPALFLDSQNISLQIPSYFTDTVWHPFVGAITTLASLDIVSTQTTRFYPDNYLRHYDFAVIFINSLLSAQSKSLPSTYVATFADVASTASYYPQLAYAADRGLIDYVITSKRGQLYAEPNAFVTKHAIYQMVSKATNVEFSYDRARADQEKMTRGEFAQLMVEVFAFEPNIFSSGTGSTEELDDETLLTKLRVLLSML